MRTFHIKAYLLASVLFGIILLAACAGPQWEQIAQSEGLTLEEKIQELVSRGASRTEVVATLGFATGYTHDTISYTVNNRYNPPMKLSFPANSMNYPDPGHHGYYRWVLSFDDRGSLYKYRRIPISHDEGRRVYEYYKNIAGYKRASWHPAYLDGFTALECIDTEHCWAAGGAGLFLETTDGGKSWVSHDSGIEWRRRGFIPSIYAISFPDSVNGWLTGHDSFLSLHGLILHSPDGGKSWSFQLKTRSAMSPGPALWSVTFTDNRQGWAVGGERYHSLYQ